MIFLYKDHIEWKSFLVFQITQATLFQQWTPESLRGYGCGTPNGVLGSISILIQSYFVLWTLYKVLHGKKLGVWIVVFFASIMIAALFPFLNNIEPTLVYKILNETIIPSLRMFLVGALVAEFYDVFIPFLKKYWYVFLVAYVIMKYTNIPDINVTHPIIRTVFIGLATLGFGYAFPKIQIKHDITYGIFIYHMVVINAFLCIGVSGSITSTIIVFIITIILAFISYLTIGKLSVNLKKDRT